MREALLPTLIEEGNDKKTIKLNKQIMKGIQALIKENFKEAEQAFRRVNEISKDHPSYLAGMAELYNYKKQPKMTLSYLKKLIYKKPHYFYYSWLLAVFNILGIHDEMEKFVEEAYKKFPEHSSHFVYYKGMVHARKKEYQQAEDCFKIAAVENEEMSIKYKSLSQLAEVYDKSGRYDEAFEFYGKSEILRMNDNRAIKENIDVFTKFMRAGKENITREKYLNGAKHDIKPIDNPPVFLFGFPRSGTTLTQQILASHPKILVGDEVAFTKDYLMELKKRIKDCKGYPLFAMTHDKEKYIQARDIYLEIIEGYFRSFNSKGKILVNKSPQIIFKFGAFRTLFPEGKFICVLRNPMDSCLSAFTRLFNPAALTSSCFSLENTVRTYIQVMELYKQYKDVFRDEVNLYEFWYEDLIDNPEKYSKELAEFLGVEWTPEMLEFYKKKDLTVTSASFDQVNKPIYKTAIEKWKRYEKYFEPYLEYLKPYTKEEWEKAELAKSA